ncbi:HAMP domain-containing sensor histidine kinase [Breznakia pachnodae]|uniref:Heme sensor protein HssS n=1 Tax=Breznakia pachnodae TaxID=265178 RepID=A0ABU0E0C5_9FIRM|nr:HAMP domain-containing sensor histidine kinase [Breznakia pachnodae]MDQ0360281.1 signal transduction histidine kinase [Breznakia pachnodae]
MRDRRDQGWRVGRDPRMPYGKRQRPKLSMRMVAAFSLTVFLIVSLTMVSIGVIVGIANLLGLLDRPNPIILVFGVLLASTLMNTVFAHGAGSRFLSPIAQLNNAMEQITRGNFDIHIPEHRGPREVGEMTRNFNIMAQELNNTQMLRNDFVSNVSHEFKTPLSSIEGYVTLLQDPSLSEEEKQAYIEKTLESTKRLSSLVNNILQLSRLENQEIVPDQTMFSLDEQVRQIVLMSQNEWSDKKINLEIDLEEVQYYGNSNFLAMVWQNIFNNALKFISNDGTIEITLKKNEDYTVVSIADDGIGMSPQTKRRIFEKFYQADNSRAHEGNGLGLSLVKRIIDLHNGKIEVQSVEGVGTTFIISLPNNAN